MSVLGCLRRIVANERGNALAIAAGALPLLIGAAAIGVDTAQSTLARRQLQRSADSAALAGVYGLVQGQAVAGAVGRDLSLNNDVPLSGSPTIENAPTVGAYAGNPNAVRVALAAERPVPFMSFFTGSTMTVNVEATAARIYQGEYCAIALERQAVTGIAIGGSANVNLGCGMISNSRGGSAVTAGGSSRVVGSPIAAVGGVPPSSSYAQGTVLQPYSPTQADPYADLPDPTVPPGCNNELRVQPTASRTVNASEQVPAGSGVYCYKGMDIKGTLDLAPGIYIIDGGSLSFGAQSVVSGDGVTFILTSRNAATAPSQIAQLDINGGATVNLGATTSGTYAGVLMYQDRRSPFGSSHVNGNSSSSFYGGFYFANRELVFNGTTGMQTRCIQLVGRRLGFSGNANIANTCDAGGGASAFDATVVRLVG